MLGGQAGYEMVGGSSKAESMYPYGSAKNAAADSARNGVLPDGGKGYGGSWRGGGGGGGAGGVSPALDEATKVEAMKEDAPRAMWAAAPRRRTGQCFLLAEGLIISYIYLVYTAAVLLPYTFHQARIEFFHDSSIFNTDDNIHTFRDRGGHGDGPFSPLSAFSVSRYILSFRPSFAFMLFACFNGCFMLLVMSIVNAIRTDPGAVPSHWGFFVGDQARRKRYCRICNVWKPDRTHHCSVCHRCVLNMDHHCPWLDNCVGFFNRKFFLLAIVYANVCLSIVFAHTLYFLGTNARTVWPSEFDLQDTSNLHGIDFTHWTLTITVCQLSHAFNTHTHTHLHTLTYIHITYTHTHWHTPTYKQTLRT